MVSKLFINHIDWDAKYTNEELNFNDWEKSLDDYKVDKGKNLITELIKSAAEKYKIETTNNK